MPAMEKLVFRISGQNVYQNNLHSEMYHMKCINEKTTTHTVISGRSNMAANRHFLAR